MAFLSPVYLYRIQHREKIWGFSTLPHFFTTCYGCDRSGTCSPLLGREQRLLTLLPPSQRRVRKKGLSSSKHRVYKTERILSWKDVRTVSDKTCCSTSCQAASPPSRSPRQAARHAASHPRASPHGLSSGENAYSWLQARTQTLPCKPLKWGSLPAEELNLEAWGQQFLLARNEQEKQTTRAALLSFGFCYTFQTHQSNLQ